MIRKTTLTIDSMGKCTKKPYCTEACNLLGVNLNYLPGQNLVQLIEPIVVEDTPSAHVLICMLNEVDQMTMAKWESRRACYYNSVHKFAQHVHHHGCPCMVIVGADVGLWKWVPHRDVYATAQTEIMTWFCSMGIKCYSGMELFLGGGLEQFRDKLDNANHIMGVYRDDALCWLEHILQMDLSVPSSTTINLSVPSSTSIMECGEEPSPPSFAPRLADGWGSLRDIYGRTYYWKLSNPLGTRTWLPPDWGYAKCGNTGATYYWPLSDPSQTTWRHPNASAPWSDSEESA